VHDTYTSTGRDLFVRFVTDAGNYGLTGTTSDPGFWMEWQFIEDGAECMSYNKISGRGIVGHNNEVFLDRTARECEELCCARDWCRSFDFLGMQGGIVPEGGTGQCALSDVDVSTNQATNSEYGSDIYERNHRKHVHRLSSLAPQLPAARYHSCSQLVYVHCGLSLTACRTVRAHSCHNRRDR